MRHTRIGISWVAAFERFVSAIDITRWRGSTIDWVGGVEQRRYNLTAKGGGRKEMATEVKQKWSKEWSRSKAEIRSFELN